jgi:hypothetical protein
MSDFFLAVLGLITLAIFIGVAIYIRQIVLQKRVPPLNLLYRQTGDVMRAGESYVPEPSDLLIPLAARRIHASHAAGKHGLLEERYMNASYIPDEANIHAFAINMREHRGTTAFDNALALRCGEKLCIDPRPNCTDVAAAFGVRFTSFDYPDQGEPEPKDDRDRIQRQLDAIVQAALANVGGVGALANHIKLMEAGEHPLQKEFPELKEPAHKKAAVDILKAAMNRAKTAQ